MANSGNAQAEADWLLISIGEEHAGSRLDRVLVAELPRLGRAAAGALFRDGHVRVAEGRALRAAKKGDRALTGQTLHVKVAQLDRRAVADEDMPLKVVEATDAWVIIDKPAGIASAPLAPGERGTAANALLARYPEMAEIGYSPREPGLCHRLDSGTSGLLLAARTPQAFRHLTAAIRGGEMDKRYLLLCQAAALPQPQGRIDFPLLPDPRNPRRVSWLDDDDAWGGRASVTHYRTQSEHGEWALVEARAGCAYRHQIRVHFAAIGAPLLGDVLYGGAEHAALEHHALHASRIAWPGDGQLGGFEVTSDLPGRLRPLVEGPTNG